MQEDALLCTLTPKECSSSFSLTIGKGATINPKGLLYLYGCTVTGNLAMVNNGQIQLVYANTFNINLVNNDTIEVWHYSNYINQNYTAASRSVILFNCKSYTTGLTFATGFNNSGKIVFNSVTSYNASLAITTGTLNNTASGVIEASGIYNLSYTISGIVTNAGKINVNNNLSFTSSSNLTNTGTITIANGYILSITNSTYTHTSGNVNGTGKFYFEGSTANFNVANMPGKYLEFYTTVINSTFLPITNAKKIRLIYGNTINCALFNTDTILYRALWQCNERCTHYYACLAHYYGEKVPCRLPVPLSCKGSNLTAVFKNNPVKKC